MMARQLPLGISPRLTYSLDGYLPGDNPEVLHHLRRMAGGNGARFLYLSGGPGSGRSHLLQALCNQVSGQGGQAIYLPLKSFAEGAPADFTSLPESMLLALDDVQAVAGDRAWEQALVGAFDAVRLSGGRIIASGNAPAPSLGLLLPDLLSRLQWGEIQTLRPLSDEDKLELLRRKGEEAGLAVGEEVGRYLLNRVSRDLPTLLGWLAKLDRESLAAQRRLTIPFVREVMARDAIQT